MDHGHEVQDSNLTLVGYETTSYTINTTNLIFMSGSVKLVKTRGHVTVSCDPANVPWQMFYARDIRARLHTLKITQDKSERTGSN